MGDRKSDTDRSSEGQTEGEYGRKGMIEKENDRLKRIKGKTAEYYTKHPFSFKPNMDPRLKSFTSKTPTALWDSSTQQTIALFLWAETSAPASVDVISFSSGELGLSQP